MHPDIYDAYCRLLALPDPPELRRGARVTAPCRLTDAQRSALLERLRAAWLTHRLSDHLGEGAANEPTARGRQARPAARLSLVRGRRSA